MQLIKAVNIISESAMLNSNKPIKFSHLQKLANQIILHGPHVVEMGNTFSKKHPWHFHENWNVSI